MKWNLLWPILLTIITPLAVSWFVYPTHFPPGFGEFPPQYKGDPPGFNLTYFLAVLAAIILISTFLLFPMKFGFKGGKPEQRNPIQVKLPLWFWIGGLCMTFFWWLMWSHSMAFGNLVYWSFTPMWWGFIFLLDGIVYKRNNGVSLFSSKPKTLLISGLVSIAGWAYFEFYDYFVLGNWYYPNAKDAPWTDLVISIEFLITYSTVTPVLLQWYNLLNTFPRLIARYQNGPIIRLNGTIMIWLGLLIIALMTIWPYPLFWSVWIGPLAVLSGILLNLKIWNPLTDLAKGNWNAAILICLSSLATGLFWEFWNHGSGLVAGTPTNPNYWVYNIPYVNVLHFFSEMPLLGYWGYLPFGLFVWQVFIWMGNCFGFSTDIQLTQK
ncbi:hypothetical protein [Alginatibacterium sediminis]|nr:hypothetical protein [Alginatibacterium sediminis]